MLQSMRIGLQRLKRWLKLSPTKSGLVTETTKAKWAEIYEDHEKHLKKEAKQMSFILEKWAEEEWAAITKADTNGVTPLQKLGNLLGAGAQILETILAVAPAGTPVAIAAAAAAKVVTGLTGVVNNAPAIESAIAASLTSAKGASVQ